MSITQCFKKHKTEYSVAGSESVYVLRIHGGGYLLNSSHWTELLLQTVTEFLDFLEQWAMEKIKKKISGSKPLRIVPSHNINCVL